MKVRWDLTSLLKGLSAAWLGIILRDAGEGSGEGAVGGPVRGLMGESGVGAGAMVTRWLEGPGRQCVTVLKPTLGLVACLRTSVPSCRVT